MLGRASAVVLVASSLVLLPQTVRAGGTEFPAGGTRDLGRGAAGFARADDPSVMFHNPALLADLYDDQAMLGAHLLLPKSCFQPTGAYGWANTGAPPDVSNFGQGPIVLNPPSGSTDLNGNPLTNYASEALPKVCYQGPAPFLPQVGVAMKLSPDLGVGFGFFPPDAATITQWGNRDGTVNTPNGKRPDPLRFEGSGGSLQAVTFFSMLGAIGYRVADWLRIGGGLQWNLVAYQTRGWTAFQPDQLNPSLNIRSDTFGRDLFVPGLIASAQVKPIDNLDIAVGYKWSDRIKGNAKLDLTPGAFGTGQLYHYRDAMGNEQTLGTSIPQVTNNQRIYVTAPPVWEPQLTFAIRYADLLKPLPKDRAKAKLLAGPQEVEDHMATERFDVEVDGVYYFTSAYDYTGVTTTTGIVNIPLLNPDGTVTQKEFAVGRCPVPLVNKLCPSATRQLKFPYGSKDQISLRAGGDYNIMPGIFALRAGVSYETDGQKPDLFQVANYMLHRIGVHGGFTLRVAHKTDISFGFAHFIQKHIKLQVNDQKYPAKYKTAQYHFQPGLGVADADGNNANQKNGFDGIAQVEVPNGSSTRLTTDIGPNFVNAGSYYMNLDVVSLSFTQHF